MPPRTAPAVPFWRISALLACLIPATGSNLAAQSGDGVLAYEVPTPPTATYLFTDTVQTTMTTPGGPMQVTVEMSATLTAAFEADPGGVRVTADLDALTINTTTPMGSEAGAPEVAGSYVLVLDRRGRVDLESIPEASGDAGAASTVAGLAYNMFPRLPDRAVEPGASWVDTVTWSHDTEQVEATSTAVYTYTLVGDTVVADGTLLKIAVAGESETKATVNTGGMAMEQEVDGSETGLVLWNAQTGHVHLVEITRDQNGRLNTPMGAMVMQITGTSRRWLEN